MSNETAQLHADVANAVESFQNDLTLPAAKPAKPAKGKAATPAKGKAKEKAKVEPIPAPKAEHKPAKMLHGVTLADDADIELVAHATDDAIKAIAKITGKDGELLPAYLELGSFQHHATAWIPSSKMRGQYVATVLPDSQKLDPALRSNCTWVWEALHVADHEASNILAVLGLLKDGDNRTPAQIIADYKSQNPTVIRRGYKEALKVYEKEAKAKEAGKSVAELEEDEKEEKLKAAAEAEKAEKAARTAFKRKLTAAIKALKKLAMEQETHEDGIDLCLEALGMMMTDSDQHERLALIESLTTTSKEKFA